MGWVLKKTVVMVGMMGSGKTAIGTALARALNVPFLDSDQEIVKAANMTIAEIFERDGEPFFRNKETQVISRLLSETPGVLSTGGGAFMSAENRQMIHDRSQHPVFCRRPVLCQLAPGYIPEDCLNSDQVSFKVAKWSFADLQISPLLAIDRLFNIFEQLSRFHDTQVFSAIPVGSIIAVELKVRLAKYLGNRLAFPLRKLIIHINESTFNIFADNKRGKVFKDRGVEFN